MGKETYHQARGIEFDPQEPSGRSSELAGTGCSLTSAYPLRYKCTHISTHTHREWEDKETDRQTDRSTNSHARCTQSK